MTVRPDPAVWLTGPREASESWVQGALTALVSDFGVVAGSEEEVYLHRVLAAFSAADLGPFRFLRMRALADAPVVARLDVAVRGPETDPLLDFGAHHAWYDEVPRVEVVDAASGLRRASRLYVDDGVRVVVRHHLHRADLGVDVVLSTAGYDLQVTASALPQLRALVEAVEIDPVAGGDR